MTQMNLSMKQTDREQACVCQAEREGLGVGIGRCKLLYIEIDKQQGLMYNTGNYVQYPVINHHLEKNIYSFIYINI